MAARTMSGPQGFTGIKEKLEEVREGFVEGLEREMLEVDFWNIYFC